MVANVPNATSQANRVSEPVPGDIIITSCSLSNYDGSDQIDLRYLALEFSIYESIFCDHIRGDILIEDALALTGVMPIVGEETISLGFKTPHISSQTQSNDPITVSGKVVKLEKLRFEQTRSEVFVLTFVSQTRLSDLMKVVRDPYGPDTISAMVKKVAKDYLGLENEKIEIESTQGQHKFVIPTWSPCETIRFLAREAISSEYKPGNFLFFETHEKHRFVTLERLLADQENEAGTPANTYFFTHQSLMKPPGVADPGEFRANPEEWRYVESIDIQQTFDIEAALENGLFDNKILWVDTLLQQYESVKINPDDKEKPHFQYLKQFGDFKHVGSHKLATEESPGKGRAVHTQGGGDSHIRFLHSTPKQTWDKFQVTPRMRQEKLSHLISSYAQLAHIHINLTIPGDTNRKPGDVITLTMPEFGATDDVINKKHRYLSGKYLVTAVRHKYTFNSRFITVLEIAKNALENEIKVAPGGKGQGA